ncbi:hypothetical protein [Methylobacterium durans]|nr:hypothetical protein [Methylobacterium durans]
MHEMPEPAIIAQVASPSEAPQLDAWCAEEIERAARLLDGYGEAAMAATMRGISLLHRVRALELGLRGVAGLAVAEAGLQTE